jgi:hypothetical protein
MKWSHTVSTVVLIALALACNRQKSENAASPTGTPTTVPGTSQVQTSPEAQTEPNVTLLIKELPAGTEGVELKTNGLAVSDGYQLVNDTPGTFSITRKRDGQSVASGGCGCTGGTCEPKLSPDGIIVCSGSSCSDTCGLALTTAGVRTEIAKF